MDIIVKDYTYITEFINRNRGKLSEAELAAIVRNMLDAEFATELLVDTLMMQANPQSIVGRRLIGYYGNVNAALEAIPHLVKNLELAHEIIPELGFLLSNGLLKSSKFFS